MNRTFNKTIATLLALIAPLVLVVFRLTFGDRVPDPLPTHWSGSSVNGTTGAGAFFVIALVISLALAIAAAVVLWRGRPDPAGRMTVCGLTFAAWLLAAVYSEIVWLAADVAVAADVELPWYAAVGVVLVPLVPAGISWRLLQGTWASPDPAANTSPIPLGADERVVWIGRASSAPLRWIGALGILVAGVLAFFWVLTAGIVFACSVALVAISQLGVRIDAVGLHTTWGPFDWPRTTVPLGQITAVHAEPIRPMEWGGWGLRITPRGKAAIVRAGEAIIVGREGRPRYLVTVDDAQQGADVLAALLGRAEHGAGPGNPGGEHR